MAVRMRCSRLLCSARSVRALHVLAYHSPEQLKTRHPSHVISRLEHQQVSVVESRHAISQRRVGQYAQVATVCVPVSGSTVQADIQGDFTQASATPAAPHATSPALLPEDFIQRLAAACTYDNLTRVLAAASVVPAFVLAVQPFLPGADLAAAEAILDAVSHHAEWQGPLRDMFSFTVLLSVFITCEVGAAAASAVSAAGAGLQMLFGPVTPPVAARFIAAGLAASASLVLMSAAAMIHGSSGGTGSAGSSSSSSMGGSSSSNREEWQPPVVLQNVQQALGVLGGGLLAQFLTTLAPQTATANSGAGSSSATAAMEWLCPVLAGALAVMLLGKLIQASNDKALQKLWADWPAWSATLLLILQPLQQLVASSIQPQQLLPNISPQQQALLVFASGLMVPRALYRRELMWFTGTFCGAALAAGQLFVLAVHHVLPAGVALAAGAAGVAAAEAASSGLAKVPQLQLQCVAIAAGVADPCGRAAATIAAMGLVLLLIWMALQAGWETTQAVEPAPAGMISSS